MLTKLKIKIEEEVKKNVFLYGINMRYRAFLVKRRYSNLRTYYEKAAIEHGIKYREENVPNQVSRLLKEHGMTVIQRKPQDILCRNKFWARFRRDYTRFA